MNEEKSLEIYKILIEQLKFEGTLIWTRNQVFLVLNSAIIAVLSIGSQSKSNIPITLAASFIGVVLCVLWLLTIERSRVYYQYWISQTRVVEELVQPSVAIFENLHQANSGKTIKIGKEEFRMGSIAKFASISRIIRLVAFAFIFVWVGLAIEILIR